jgi:hypothetical protein
MGWINYILALLKSYPEVTAIGFGVMSAGLIVAVVDQVYFPEAWSFRKAQQVAVAINLVIGTGASYGLWRFLDPADSRWFDLWVSALSMAGSPMALYLGSKLISWKFPSLQLSFGLLANRKP